MGSVYAVERLTGARKPKHNLSADPHAERQKRADDASVSRKASVLTTSRVDLADRDFKRILLIKLSAFGDVVHTIALLNALRKRYPTAQIDWLLKPSVAELIRHQPGVSNVLVYGESHTESPRYNWDGVTHFMRLMRDSRFLGLLRRLRATRYELVVDVHGQMRTGFVTRLTGAQVRIGFDRPRPEVWERAGMELPEGTVKRVWKGAREGSWHAYTHHIALETLDLHAIDRYMRVGRLLGFADDAPDFSFHIPRAAEERIDRLLAERGIDRATAPILMAPAALWETKRWRPQQYCDVARHFLAAGHRVILAGAADERDECAAIAAAVPGAIDLSGATSLIDLAALVRRCAVCLTNDSGPMHLSVALGRPVVAVFGPTNPRWVGPYRHDAAVVRSHRACSPCYLRDLARCPHDQACMREVQASEVIARIASVLDRETHS